MKEEPNNRLHLHAFCSQIRRTYTAATAKKVYFCSRKKRCIAAPSNLSI